MFRACSICHWLFATLMIVLYSGATFSQQVFVVGFAQDTLGNDWRAAQVEEARQELTKHDNVRFVVTDGKGNTGLQAQQIEDLAQQGIDLLITSPREQAVLSTVIAKVYQQGIPVVLLDRGIEGDSYTTFIRPDNRPIATAAGQYLAKALQGKGHILMLEGIQGATPTIHRTDGFLKVLNDYPDITVTRKVANYLRGDAIMAVESVLGSGIKFDAIYAQSDSMASGARMALSLHGIDPSSLPIVGIDYIKEAQEAIRKGEQSVSFTYPTGGREGALAALKILAGEAVEKEIVLESTEVTSSNVDTVTPIF